MSFTDWDGGVVEGELAEMYDEWKTERKKLIEALENAYREGWYDALSRKDKRRQMNKADSKRLEAIEKWVLKSSGISEMKDIVWLLSLVKDREKLIEALKFYAGSQWGAKAKVVLAEIGERE